MTRSGWEHFCQIAARRSLPARLGVRVARSIPTTLSLSARDPTLLSLALHAAQRALRVNR
jgi:hypothetical protein